MTNLAPRSVQGGPLSSGPAALIRRARRSVANALQIFANLVDILQLELQIVAATHLGWQ
jgi:hypothetical protein